MATLLVIFYWYSCCAFDIEFCVADKDLSRGFHIAFVALSLLCWITFIAAFWVDINGKL